MVGNEDHLAFDLLNGRMVVTAEAGATSKAILKAVERTCMQAEPWLKEHQEEGHGRPLALQARTALTVLSALLIFAAFNLHATGGAGWLGALGWQRAEGASTPALVRSIYAPATLATTWFILPKAWFSVRRLRPDMNLLMTIAMFGAMSIGDWLKAARGLSCSPFRWPWKPGAWGAPGGQSSP